MKEVNNANLFADASEKDNASKSASGLAGESKNELAAKLPSSIAQGKGNAVKDDSSVEVAFCTGGRLSAPAILHFRDYTMLASQELAELSSTADDHLPTIVKVLNSMVVEDFDCGLLHIEEAKEALLSVHAKWWGKNLSGFRYLLDPDIKDEKKLLAKENISVADIPIANIAQKIKMLDPAVKEPINITVHGVTVKFVFPRIRNAGIANTLLKEHFAVEEQKFASLKQLLAYNKNQSDPTAKKEIDVAENEEYEKYLVEKARWRLIYMRAQEICGIDDKVLETLEDRVDAIVNDNRITARHWQLYTSFLSDKGDFGIRDEVEFYSDILNKNVVRPFRFYTYSFLPSGTMEQDRNVDGTVSFG